MSRFTYTIVNNAITAVTDSGVGSSVATIPDSITSIDGFGYTSVTELICTSSSALTNLGTYAFVFCTSLTRVTLGTNLLSIGVGCFQNCSSLPAITIPNTVTLIDSNCFTICTSLTSVILSSSITYISPSCFSGCTSLPSITIPSTVVFMGNNCFDGCTSLLNITIPNAVTLIDGNAFINCTGLTSVTLNRTGTLTQLISNTFFNTPSINKSTMVNLLAKGYNPSDLTTAGFSNISRFTYTISSNVITAVTVTSGVGTTYAVIPDSVTSIANSVFNTVDARTLITEFICTSESLLTQFGISVFSGCINLINVTLNSTSLKILGGSCFQGTSLPNITIPNSVTTINQGCFGNCSSLTSIEIPNSVISIGFYAFENCSTLRSVIISNSLTSIADGTFYNCTSLLSVTIPSAVTTIGENAFENCTGLTSVTLEGTLPNLNTDSFYNTPSINKSTMVNLLAKGYNPSDLTTAGFSNISRFTYTISSNVITAVTVTSGVGTTYAVIPDSVTSIAIGVFNTVDARTVITEFICTSGSLLNQILDIVFLNCTNLTSVTLSTNLTSIGGCFQGCTALPNITIPNLVTSIGVSCFDGCTSLTSAILSNSLTLIGSDCFQNCTALPSVTLPISLTSIPANVFRYCTSLISVTILGPVVSIANFCFGNCSELPSIELPNSLTSIGISCFGSCSKLANITIPSAVTLINLRAFQNCTGLTSVTLNCVGISTGLGSNSFLNTPSINKSTMVNLLAKGYNPSDLTTAGFSNISRFTYTISSNVITAVTVTSGVGTTYAVIPDSVTSIAIGVFNTVDARTVITEFICTSGSLLNQLGNSVFQSCGVLSSVTLSSTLKSIGTSCFKNCSVLPSITIPNTVTLINTNCFQDCTSLTNIIISNSVTFLSEYCFDGCSALTNVTIPDSVILISNFCFQGCSSLISVSIPSAVTLIDTNAFQNCTGLTSVTLNCDGTSTDLSANSFIGTTSMNDSTVRILLAKGYLQSNLSTAGFKTVSRFTYDISNNVILSVTDNTYGTTVATIPDSVTSTADVLLFDNNKNTLVTDLICTSTSSLTRFGNNAFQGCTNLTNVTLNLTSLTSIGNSSFKDCSKLPNITIPGSVTLVGVNAFQNCTGLTSVNCVGTSTGLSTDSFLNTPSINQTSINNLSANGYTQLQLNTAGFKSRFTYTYDSSLNTIITSITVGDTGTTVATIPNSVTSTADAILFSNTTIITDLICATGSLLTRFGNNAFQGCTSLTNVTLNSTFLKSIGNSSFKGCSALTNVSIPSAVTLIDTNAFQNCTGLTSVTLNCDETSTVLNPDSFLNTPSINDLTVKNLLEKGYTQLQLTSAGFKTLSRFTYDISNNIIIEVIDNIYGTTVATIPDAVTSTVDSIFLDNTDITALICTSDSLLRQFGNDAFNGCIHLTNITLVSTSLKSISDSCFKGCSALTNVTIPSAVTLIDTNAFQNCTGLTSVTLNCDETSTVLNPDSFLNTPSINPTSVTNLFVKGYTELQLTNAGFTFRFSYTIENNVIIEVIDSGVGSTVAIIPDSVIGTVNYIFLNNTVISNFICTSTSLLTQLGIGVFKGCINLTSVILSSNYLTYLPSYCFAGCSFITNITIPNSVTYIGSACFSGCSALSSITLPNSLGLISNSCFSGCSSLINVTIPSAVTLIESYAFKNCTMLTSVILNCVGRSTFLNTKSFLNTPSMSVTTVINLSAKGYNNVKLTNAGFIAPPAPASVSSLGYTYR